MRLIIWVNLFFFLFTSQAIQAQTLSAAEIIEKSIAYHDPDGKMMKKKVTLHLIETRPNGSDRKSIVSFHIKKDKFVMVQHIDDHEIASTLNCGKAKFYYDKETEFSNEIAEKYRLNEERVKMMKDYYQYLWLMPLKLNDEGTNLNPLVKSKDFFGKESLEVRVTYDPGVGADVWYFYFNPTSYALQGYRFYHDEEKNDGEYIILDEEVTFENVRIPKERKWYTHKEDKFLGADILDKLMF